MATEQRLIDAYALSEKIGNMKFEITHNRGGYRYCNEDEKNEWDKLDGFDSLVCDAPTVDAVPVVRCKDCVYAKNNYLVNGLCLCKKPLHDVVKGEIPRNTLMDEDDFCSYGERRTDNG